MATAEDIAAFRLLIAEPDDIAPYTDAALSDRIDAAGSLDELAYQIWLEKAAAAASLVDISEGGSSRKQGDLYEQYLSMAGNFADRVTSGAPPGATRTQIHRLVRP